MSPKDKARIRSDPDYKARCRAFIKSHGNSCALCGARDNLLVHHSRQDLSAEEYASLVSCIVLCRRCHYKHHYIHKKKRASGPVV